MKKAVGWMLITSFALGHSAPLTAQEIQGTPKIDEEAVRRVLQAINVQNLPPGRAEQLEQDNARTEQLIEQLAARVEDQANLLEATNTLLNEFVKSRNNAEQARKRAAQAQEKGQTAIKDATPTVGKKLGAALDASKPEHWKDNESAREQGDKITREMKLAWREIQEQRRENEKRLATTCKDAVVDEQAKSALESHVEGKVPQKWTADLVSIAQREGVKLPACFDEEDENGQTLRDAIAQSDEDRSAFEEVKDAIKTILSVITEVSAVTITLILSPLIWLGKLFNNKSGGSGGDGERSGSGGGETSHNKEVRKTRSDEYQSQDDGEDRRDDENGDNDQDGRNDEQGDEIKGTGDTDGAGTISVSVEPGLGVTVEVFEGGIKLTDDESGEQWYADWPPRTGNKQMQFPELNESMTIVSADVAAKRLTIRMSVNGCAMDVPVALELVAQPKQPGTLEVADVPNECVL